MRSGTYLAFPMGTLLRVDVGRTCWPLFQRDRTISGTPIAAEDSRSLAGAAVTGHSYSSLLRINPHGRSRPSQAQPRGHFTGTVGSLARANSAAYKRSLMMFKSRAIDVRCSVKLATQFHRCWRKRSRVLSGSSYSMARRPWALPLCSRQGEERSLNPSRSPRSLSDTSNRLAHMRPILEQGLAPGPRRQPKPHTSIYSDRRSSRLNTECRRRPLNTTCRDRRYIWGLPCRLALLSSGSRSIS